MKKHFLLICILVISTFFAQNGAPVTAGEIGPAAVLAGTQTAAGDGFSCVLTADTGIVCWGYGEQGQMGNGQALSQAFPVPVSGLESGVQAVNAGSDHACALTAGGAVRCWGSNAYGQLGSGSAGGFSSTPVEPLGLSGGVAAVSAGGRHTCALMAADGSLLCWGDNTSGQLGSGTTGGQSASPQAVPGLSGLQAVSAGSTHTCALTSGGAAQCWGANSQGQLGDNSQTTRPSPVAVTGLDSGVTAISAGWSFTCAVVNGAAKCWGVNFQSQLGNPVYLNSPVPVDVTGLGSGVTAIEAGGQHACALTTAGAVLCWGNGPQLGDGVGKLSAVPVSVTGMSAGATQLSAGYSHTCAVTPQGGVCWGLNNEGQLGGGADPGYQALPRDVLGLTSGALAVSTGADHTCALTTAGGIKCWGGNAEGQLGDGSTINRGVPVVVSGMTGGMHAVSAGYYFTCALSDLGAVWCWGLNSSGQLGDGTTEGRLQPVAVSGLPAGILAVSAGSTHACALDPAGLVWCWGANGSSQLGNGESGQSETPVQADELSETAAALSAGGVHTCARTTAGEVKCWGADSAGQLGNGEPKQSSPQPVGVLNLTTGAVFESGAAHTCAISAGALKCWGSNTYGRLGDGGIANQSAPVDVSGFAGSPQAVSAGGEHSCALNDAGGVQCWGRNARGQLGDGGVTSQPTPVQVNGLSSGAAGVDAGYRHTCALTSAGGVKCWGDNAYGQLGYRDLNVPVTVLPGVRVMLPMIYR
jgi:alpha-tubulin suppressor-like RCC1 family protein